MLRKIGCLLLLFSVLSALNVQWAVLQGVAWASMLSKEVRQTEDFRVAIDRTFGGEYPCDLCGLVQANLKENPAQQAAGQAEFLSVKLLPLPLSAILLPAASLQSEFCPEPQGTASSLRFSPEPPPPRLA